MKQQHHNKSYKLRVTSYKFKNKEKLLTHHGLRIMQHGFSLVELMIAIFIGVIIIGATYAAYISQERSFASQDQVAEMNTSSKIALDMIASDIREAGFGLAGAGTFNINGFTNAITATDSSTAPDMITLVGGLRRAGTLCSNSAGTAIDPGDTQFMLVSTSGGKSLSNINTTDKRNITFAGLSFGVVTAVNNTTGMITLQNSIGKTFPQYTDLNGDGNCDDGEGVPVYVVEDTTYQVVGTELQRVRRMNCAIFGGGPNCDDTDVIAGNIDDFQIRYGYDTDNNGVINPATEYYDLPPGTDRLLRIRVNILARTARLDPNFEGQGSLPAAIENRNHAAINDSFRRRWWQMAVDLRNPI